MADPSWIDHPANLRANAALLRIVANQAERHADEIDRLNGIETAARALVEQWRMFGVTDPDQWNALAKLLTDEQSRDQIEGGRK